MRCLKISVLQFPNLSNVNAENPIKDQIVFKNILI